MKPDFVQWDTALAKLHLAASTRLSADELWELAERIEAQDVDPTAAAAPSAVGEAVDAPPDLAGLLAEIAKHRHIFNAQEWVPFGAIEVLFERALADRVGGADV